MDSIPKPCQIIFITVFLTFPYWGSYLVWTKTILLFCKCSRNQSMFSWQINCS